MRVFALWPNIFRKNVFVLMEYAILFLNVFSYFMETYVNVSTKGVQASSTKLGSQKTTFILLCLNSLAIWQWSKDLKHLIHHPFSGQYTQQTQEAQLKKLTVIYPKGRFMNDVMNDVKRGRADLG